MILLPDSSLTKRALATALKELMQSRPFNRISVSDICERCEMNRKSFYYHFKDKYDLVNWIYYSECIAVIQKNGYDNRWELLDDLCACLYDNRSFYRKTLEFEGQNSFSAYFRNIIISIISDDMKQIYANEGSTDFFVNFYADAFLCAIKRWLTQKDCMPADEFTRLLRRCLIDTTSHLIRDYSC